MDSPVVLDARASLAGFARRLASDDAYRLALRDPKFVPDDFRGVGELLRFLEHIAVLVARGGIAEALIFAEYADTFVEIWEQVYPAVVERRVAFGPHTGRAFEHLAMRAKRYIESGQMAREYDALEADPRLHLPGAQSPWGTRG